MIMDTPILEDRLVIRVDLLRVGPGRNPNSIADRLRGHIQDQWRYHTPDL
jgi:hypothetical protein